VYVHVFQTLKTFVSDYRIQKKLWILGALEGPEADCISLVFSRAGGVTLF
jgi:hypothetical protein